MRSLLVLTLAAIALAGCSGGGTSSGTTPTMEGGKYVIHLTANNRFQPAEATVPAGATVVWVTDGGLHDVTEGGSGSSHAWSSDDNGGAKLSEGDRYEHTFADKGTVHYRCMMHESMGMVGTLTVT